MFSTPMAFLVSFRVFWGCSSKSSGGFREAHLLGKPPRATSRTRSASAGPAQVLQRWPQIAGFLWTKSQLSVQIDDMALELNSGL